MGETDQREEGGEVSPIRVQNKFFSTRLAEKGFKTDLFISLEAKFPKEVTDHKENAGVEVFPHQGSK